jgi:glucodextranase-like protein
VAQKRKSAFQISYVTITYRSVLMGMVLVLLLAGVVMYFAFPETANRIIAASQIGLGKVLAKMGISNGSSTNAPEPGPQQAHFTNIDGTVRVRKATTNTWVTADYSLVLDKGDYVQTSPEGIAKVVFTDGTNYTIKPDSLINIQENSVNSAQQTKVAVQVTSGIVDLATPTLTEGSKSQVSVAGAVASLKSDSAAEVINDPRADQHSVMVKKGSGEVTRGTQTLPLEDYTKVSFSQNSTGMTKTKELRPPILISPPPMQSVFLDSTTKGVNFSWSPVDNVREYHLRISKSASFAGPLLVDDKKPATTVLVTNLPEGVYYWQVASIGQDGKESIESEISKFTVAPRGNGSLALDLDYVQLGHVIEIKGRTEPNARVMVNGQEAVVGNDGAFHHFTNPLPTGENVITVTAQNAKGDVNTAIKHMVIQ